jgi:NCS1 family nucleobase:cation symporter-1
MIGLHRDPTDWNIPKWQKAVRKRLWWATFMTDCWSASCHGNPPLIALSSFNTTPLDLSHMRLDENVEDGLLHLVDPVDAKFELSSGARFLALVQLTQELRTVLDHAR